MKKKNEKLIKKEKTPHTRTKLVPYLQKAVP